MKRAPFTVQEITETITDESAARGDVAHYDIGDVTRADFRAAMAALESQCFDHIDDRGDGTLIAYPADYSQDMRTGDYSGTTVAITSPLPHWTTRLVTLYHAREEWRARKCDGGCGRVPWLKGAAGARVCSNCANLLGPAVHRVTPALAARAVEALR